MLGFYTAAWKIWKKNKIFELFSTMKETQIKGAGHLEELDESIKEQQISKLKNE